MLNRRRRRLYRKTLMIWCRCRWWWRGKKGREETKGTRWWWVGGASSSSSFCDRWSHHSQFSYFFFKLVFNFIFPWTFWRHSEPTNSQDNKEQSENYLQIRQTLFCLLEKQRPSIRCVFVLFDQRAVSTAITTATPITCTQLKIKLLRWWWVVKLLTCYVEKNPQQLKINENKERDRTARGPLDVSGFDPTQGTTLQEA